MKIQFFILYALGFLWSFASALPMYSQSSFLESIIGIDSVGIYLAAATAATAIAILLYPIVIRYFTNLKAAVLVASFTFINLVLLPQTQDLWLVLVFFVLQFVGFSLLMINLDIFLERISDTGRTGQIRTTLLTINSLAVLLAPIAMGQLVSAFSYDFPYFVSGILLLPTLLLLFFKRPSEPKKNTAVFRQFRELAKLIGGNHDLTSAFLLSLSLNFFFAIMVLYVPIYLNQHIGFNWQELGVLFTIMLLPYVFLELPAGTIADRYLGEKELAILGVLIMSASSLAIFFLSAANFIAWLIVLFASRVGAALLEAMTETYFFKKVQANDVDLINTFRVFRPLGYLLGSGLSVAVLLFLPLPYLFILLAATLLLALYPAITMTDTR